MNQRKTGVVLTYISQIAKILTGLLYTPIMLRLLGKSEYGLYQLVYSVVSYLGLLSMGFGSSYMRFYSQRKAKNDIKGIEKLNGMFMFIFLCISAICIVCGFFMIINITKIFGNGLNETEYNTARALMFLMIFSLAITFPNSVFDCNLIAHEEFIFQKLLSLTQSLLNPFLALPLLLLGKGSVGIVLVSTILTVLSFILNGMYCIKKLHMKFSFHGMEISLLKEMWVFTFFIFLSQIIDQVNWSVDKLLLGRIIGTGAVAVYGVGGQINSMYLEFSTAISNVFIPEVNRLVAGGNDNCALTQLFTKVGRVQFFIIMLILSGFTLIGQSFVVFWAGVEYKQAYLVTLFLIVPVTIPLIQNLGIEIQRAKNMHKSRSLVYLGISVLNVLISIPLIKTFGAVGAAMGTAVALILGNILFINWYYHFKIHLDIVYFWKSIIKTLPSICVPWLVGLFITKLFIVQSFLQMTLFIIFYTCFYLICIWCFGFNSYEKKLIYGIVLKIKR